MMTSVLKWFNRGTEAIAAAMLAAMFLTFVLQIFGRYVLVSPFGWTLELCLALWIWIVFWGNAFVVRDRDHVRFDILYFAVPKGPRKVLALISAGAIAVGMAISFLPTWDYIDFLRIKKSATLKLPMRDLFSVYAVFMIAVGLRSAWSFVQILRHGPTDEPHIIHIGEEG